MQPIYSMQSTYLVFYIAEHGKILDRIISRFDGGIRRKNINLSSNHWVLIPIMFDIGYVLRWFDKRQHFKYDYLALLRPKTPGFYNPVYRLTSSEACADMLELVDSGSYGLKKLHQWAVDNATSN